MSDSVELCPTHSLLTVGGIARGSLADEATQVLVESARGGKTAHAQ